MKHHVFGGLIGLLVLGSALSGCEAVQSIEQTIKNFSWGKGQTVPSGMVEAANVPVASLVADMPAHCPKLQVVGDLSRIFQFSNPKSPVESALVASAAFTGIDAVCQVSPNSVTLEITMDFDGKLGPVGAKNGASEANYTYPYFLSVVNPKGQILSKDVFALSMVYTAGETALHKQDRLRQTIPLMAGQNASQFQVVVGFQLSEDELAYNRTAK